MAPCKHCRGTGAIWCRSVGTWEPCGCDEWDDAEAEDDGPDADDARDRRIDEELMGYDDDRRDDDEHV
jgi:hypothetical protein